MARSRRQTGDANTILRIVIFMLCLGLATKAGTLIFGAPRQVASTFDKPTQAARPTMQDIPAPVQQEEESTDEETKLHAYVVRRIVEDMDRLPKEQLASTRYLSLAHLYHTGSRAKHLKDDRKGLAKAINMLSTMKEIVPLVAIDAKHELIFRINIDQLGWKKETWESLGAAHPFSLRYSFERSEEIYAQFKTRYPVLRADWFVANALKAPHYYSFLKLPNRETELESQWLRIQPGKSSLKGVFAREMNGGRGFQIEQHAAATGVYWKLAPAPNVAPRALPARAIAPRSTPNDQVANESNPDREIASKEESEGEIERPFHLTGRVSMFTLPNGLPGFMLSDTGGNRRDELAVPPTEDYRQMRVLSPLSCLECHASGTVTPSEMSESEDEATSNLEAALSDDENGEGRFDEVSESIDFASHLDSGHAAQEDPDTEILNRMTARYNQRLSARDVAAELGLMQKGLAAYGLSELSTVTSGGSISRADFARAYAHIVSKIPFRKVKVQPIAPTAIGSPNSKR